MACLTRRGVLGGGVAAVAAGTTGIAVALLAEVVPVAHDPDAPLLAMCTQFLELQAKIDASYAREAEQFRALKRQGAAYEQLNAVEMAGEADRLPFEGKQRALLNDIGDISAATLLGQQVRARVLIAWYCLGKNEHDDHGTALEWYRLKPLFQDLLGGPI